MILKKKVHKKIVKNKSAVPLCQRNLFAHYRTAGHNSSQPDCLVIFCNFDSVSCQKSWFSTYYSASASEEKIKMAIKPVPLSLSYSAFVPLVRFCPLMHGSGNICGMLIR